jgi:pantetheine-phosphate adenylyltransferase
MKCIYYVKLNHQVIMRQMNRAAELFFRINIFDKLNKYNIPIEVLDRYYEPHRYYHNIDHILDMLNRSLDRYKNVKFYDELTLAIIFHDIIYDPQKNDNEEQSAELFYSFLKNDDIKQAILETKNHKPSTPISYALCELDMYSLYNDFPAFLKNSYNIFKEYQFVDFSVYQARRHDFLVENNVNPEWIAAIDAFRPKIAIYPGSFDSFHIGHLNILKKAEAIFDKVIIARGVNSTKRPIAEMAEMPEVIKNRQIITYEGLLTDFIDSLDYDVTVIRGLRNTTDLQYELTQYRYLQDLKPDIKVISLFCDKEHEHISSSSIKMLEKFNKHKQYLP